MAKKTIKEMIEVMEWYEGGGAVECIERGKDNWGLVESPIWDWYTFDYRIKKPKQKVTIEKWLIEGVCIDAKDIKVVIETSDIDSWLSYYPKAKKIKLIESYEVEI